MYRPLIFPSQLLYHGTPIVPTTVSHAGTHQFAHALLAGEPELEPEVTPDLDFGMEPDAPRRPLPRYQVLANLAALRASDDPALQEKGRSFERHDYEQAVAAYEAWELRQ
jgi:hypothetical protein